MTAPSRLIAAPYLRFAAASVAVTCAASPWLVQLVRFALKSDLYSHTILIPFVSVWLVWMRRNELPKPGGFDFLGTAIVSALAVAAILVAWVVPAPAGERLHALTWMTAAYALGLIAAGFACLGRRFMQASRVPALFLAFMIPMPGAVEAGIETALQRASAEATHVFFSLSGMPFLRDGQVFTLPGISLEIAQECSGIHSSLVLFIVSIVAGQLLLPPGWRRWAIAGFVLPLAVLRNGFRVWVLGELSVRIGPHMIHHWIHHRGGPIFFALSLIPFFALLLILQRLGRNRSPASAKAGATTPPEPPVAESAAPGRSSPNDSA